MLIISPVLSFQQFWEWSYLFTTTHTGIRTKMQSNIQFYIFFRFSFCPSLYYDLVVIEIVLKFCLFGWLIAIFISTSRHCVRFAIMWIFHKIIVERTFVTDKKHGAVVLPVFGMAVPFHISTIKNLSMNEEPGKVFLRINFFTPGGTFGRAEPVAADVSWFSSIPFRNFYLPVG